MVISASREPIAAEEEPPYLFSGSTPSLMRHNSFPVRDGSTLEAPRVRQLLKYLLLVLGGITTGSLTPPCLTWEIKDSAGTGIPFSKTLVCLKVALLQWRSQIASVSTQGAIKLCYHSAWGCLIGSNGVWQTNVAPVSLLLVVWFYLCAVWKCTDVEPRKISSVTLNWRSNPYF